jgi:hypothetical protein
VDDVLACLLRSSNSFLFLSKKKPTTTIETTPRRTREEIL